MKLIDRKLLAENIEKIARYDIDENNVFGSAYLVMQNGELLYENYFGYKDIEGRKKVDREAIFRLASMTKPITAVAILILVDRGLISLFDPVKKYIPEFSNIHIRQEDGTSLGATKTDVTIFHLLTHTSGFGRLDEPEMTKKDKQTAKNTVSRYIKEGLYFEPFTKQQYSPYASFDVLVEIIEMVTKMDYEDFLQAEIFRPLQMTDTTFIPNESQWERMVMMHNKVDGKNSVAETTKDCIFLDFPCTHKLGGGGLVSTLLDYSKFAQMLLDCGKAGKGEIVSKKTLALLSTPHVPESLMPWDVRWGLGVRVVTREEYKLLPVGSYGWSGAFGSHFWVDPENKIVAVFMKNSRFDGGSGNKSAVRFEEAVNNSLREG